MSDWFTWIENESLRETFSALLGGEKLSEADAIKAVSDLATEGEGHIKRLVGDSFYRKYFLTDRVGPPWDDDKPIGWVDHYTAGVSARGTLRWFSSQKRDTPLTSSSHYVMSRRGVIATVVNPLKSVAWHARKTSYTHIGVEHVNAGLLSKSGTKILYMEQHLYPLDRVPHVQEVYGELWEPYLSTQVVNNIALKRLLICALPTLLQKNFVDHEMVDPTRKKDCGPLWPLANLNRLVFSWKPIKGFDSLEPTVMAKNVVALFNSEAEDLLA